MQGEVLDRVELTAAGLAGDRAYAVIDRAGGKVASAKQPRAWGRLLDATARFVDEPAGGASPPPVLIELPDGTSVRSDAADVDAVLSAFLGRPVHLASTAPPAARFDEVWPDVEGLAPEEFVAATRAGSIDGDPVSELALAAAAPGTFFDLAPLHLLTTSTLDALRAANPGGDFDVRRYRPNVLVATEAAGFVENGWAGHAMGIGPAHVAATIPTMRCVMTTLAQPGLAADLSLLRTIAAANRIEIGGIGRWACAGVYAEVTLAGTIARGDAVTVVGRSSPGA